MAEHNSHKKDLIIECTDWRGEWGELMQSMHSNMLIAHDQQVVKRNLKCLHGGRDFCQLLSETTRQSSSEQPE